MSHQDFRCLNRVFRHHLRPAGHQGEGHPLRGRPHLRGHPQIEEAAGLEDLPGGPGAHQRAASVGGEAK